MSSLPNDVSRCAGVCCEVRESCLRYMDRDQWHGVLWWTDYSLLGEQVMRIEDCESGVAMNVGANPASAAGAKSGEPKANEG